MTQRYGPYPIQGRALRESEEGHLSMADAVLQEERWPNEDVGSGFDNVEKVATLFQIWSLRRPWVDIANWYGRRLQPLGWRPFPGDQYRAASRWPWDDIAEHIDFVREGQEFLLDHYADWVAAELASRNAERRSHIDDTWFSVTIKAWSPGHERHPALAEQLGRERQERRT